jgi:hypothetical protein
MAVLAAAMLLMRGNLFIDMVCALRLVLAESREG